LLIGRPGGRGGGFAACQASPVGSPFGFGGGWSVCSSRAVHLCPVCLALCGVYRAGRGAVRFGVARGCAAGDGAAGLGIPRVVGAGPLPGLEGAFAERKELRAWAANCELFEFQATRRLAACRLLCSQHSNALGELVPLRSKNGPTMRFGPCVERRGRDLNPRRACTLNGFRDRPVRPLRHPSERPQA
jgi:hypothetical protein